MLKNLLQNFKCQVREICNVAFQVCLNSGPWVQNGPAPGDPLFEPYKYIEHIHKLSSSEPLGSDA